MNHVSQARERLTVYGSKVLSDAELLTVITDKPQNETQRILEAVEGLDDLHRLCPSELRELKLTLKQATRLCAAMELGRRANAATLSYDRPLQCPQEVADYVRARIGSEERETFMILGLDARQRVKLVETIHVGSLAQVDVHPREVFRPLIRAGMHAFICAHNHPSQDAAPSDADHELTERLVRVGKEMGISPAGSPRGEQARLLLVRHS